MQINISIIYILPTQEGQQTKIFPMTDSWTSNQTHALTLKIHLEKIEMVRINKKFCE